MKRQLRVQGFLEKAQQLHNGKYDYSQVNYVNSRTKVCIICPEHGPFEQLPSSHLQGNGCPKCARMFSDEHKEKIRSKCRAVRGMTTDEWIERARQVHGDRYDYSQTEYVNQRTNVKIICPIHGLFEQKADSHIRGIGCRKCGVDKSVHSYSHEWSDEQREKIKATCNLRYGTDRYLDSDEGRKKMDDIRNSEEFRTKMHDIISSDSVQTKTKQTCVDRYGVTSAMKLPDTLNKVYEAKRTHGTWSTSKPEEKMYEILCDRFGEQDVVRQYKDLDRYPFCCDFYVKSLDLFIELNATWMHGGHWYDESNLDDVARKNEWLQLGKSLYHGAVDVWTVRDVKKRSFAVSKGLNYVVFWKNDLSDFLEWIDKDTLELNNI